MKASTYKIAKVFVDAGFLEKTRLEKMVAESGKSLAREPAGP